MTIRILHNPRCSKSRATLKLLQEQGIEPEITLYLESPPDAGELRHILNLLGMKPREFMRKGETEFSEQGLDDETLSDDELINAMVATPRLIQRPIVLGFSQPRVSANPWRASWARGSASSNLLSVLRKTARFATLVSVSSFSSPWTRRCISIARR